MPATTVSRKLTELPAWRALAAHYQAHEFNLARLFAADPHRVPTLSARSGGVLLDYSKQLLDAETMRLLVNLARERGLDGAIARLYAGEHVNASEDRAALHTALRAESPVMQDGHDVTVNVHRELERMHAFVDTVVGTGRPLCAGEVLAARALSPHQRQDAPALVLNTPSSLPVFPCP